jgi:PAS domain S-box-containing protein
MDVHLLLESVNQNISEAIFRSNERGLVYVNRAFVKMFGFDSVEEVLNASPENMYKEVSRRNELIRMLEEEGFFENQEAIFLKKNGEEFIGIESSIRYKDEDGNIFWDGAVRDVTKERLAMKKLKENEQMLQSITRNINEAIYRSNENGLIYVSKGHSSMFGYDSEEELLNSNSRNLYKDQSVRKKLSEKLLLDGVLTNEEVVFVKKDGSEFIGLVNCIPGKDEDGNVYWDGAVRDITKERSALAQYQSNEQLLQSINRNINEAIYRSAHGEGLIYVNDEFARMFGYQDVDDVIQTQSLNLYRYPEERKALGDEIVEKESITNKEVEFRRKDGSFFWGYLNSIKVVGVDGRVFFDGAIRDITIQKKNEVIFKRRDEMQQLLIDISSKFINLPLDQVQESISETLENLGHFVGSDRVYIFEYGEGGKTCTYTHGWNRDEVKPVKPNSKNIPVSGQLKELSDHHFRGEHLFISNIDEMPDGYQKDTFKEQGIKSLLSVPMIYDNQCLGFVGFDSVLEHTAYSNDEIVLLKLFADMMLNLNIRTQDQSKLRKLVDTTAEQNTRLKDFSYIISHNFRSSVANIEGLIGVLKDDPSNVEYMRMLQQTTSKLTEAIGNINELLNFEKGVTDLDRQETNVYEVINSVIQLNNKVIREKKLEIEIEVPKDLVLKTIPVYLESILHNLITNAIKYGTTSSRKKINIRSRIHKKFVSLKVQDFGLGIDLKKYQEKVFKLGSRFHSQEGDGQGMGLFMTKHQVEALGGKIDVKSEVNVGTTFIVVFYE